MEGGSPALYSCFRDRASWPDAHRNLHLRLSLAGDTWRERLRGRGVRGAETEDDPLNFCTKIQMWHLGFIVLDPLWCLESRSVAQCRVEGYAGGITESRNGGSGSPQLGREGRKTNHGKEADSG